MSSWAVPRSVSVFALAALEAQDTTRVEYGGLRVLDLEAMRSSVFRCQKSLWGIIYKG